MKKHTSIRIFHLLMALILIAVALPASNYTASAEARSDPYYQSYGIGLGPASGGGLHMFFNVTGKRTMDMIGVSFYQIQRRYNGGWSNVSDLIEGKIMLNSSICAFGRDFSDALSGVQYRVYARLYIRDYSGTVAQIDYYSQSYTLP